VAPEAYAGGTIALVEEGDQITIDAHRLLLQLDVAPDGESRSRSSPMPCATVPSDGIVLDAFGGSGTTLIAAEKVGRRARVLEIDPCYVDVAIRRWQAFTGKAATLAGSTLTLEEVEAERAAPPEPVVA
jgi:hypothetical protein